MRPIKSENVGIANITMFEYDKVSMYGGKYTIFKNGIEVHPELCLDAAREIFSNMVAYQKNKDAAKYRILTEDRKVKFTGTEKGSWFKLDQAKELVDYSKGEMIYEYNENQVPLWEVL